MTAPTPMAWNWMLTEYQPADRTARPMIGPGGYTRDQAHAEVQATLDRLAATNATGAAVFGQLAETWRAGAREDTVYAELFCWTIYEYPAGEDPRRAAVAWLEDFAERMLATGLVDEITVAQLPGDQP